MSAADQGTGDRVVGLLRELELDAAKWREERDALAAECERWAGTASYPFCLAPLPLKAAAPPPTLSRRCRDLAVAADEQDRRAAAATRALNRAGLRASEEEARQQEATEAAQQATAAARKRTEEAKRLLAEVQRERKEAEERHRTALAKRETQAAEEVAELERKIESVRSKCQQHVKEGRQACQDQKQRAIDTVAKLEADFQAQCAELEAAMERYTSDCQRAIEGADQRREQASNDIEDGWHQCEAHRETVRREAEEQVQLQEMQRTAFLEDINMMLGDHEEALSLEIMQSAEREVALLVNHSAEEHAARTVQEIDDDIQRRRKETEEYCEAKARDITALFEEAMQEAAVAAAKSIEVQDAAEEEVDRILPEVFNHPGHEKDVAALQAQIQEAITLAREALRAARANFDQQTQQLQRDVGKAMMGADQLVEQSRSKTQAALNQSVAQSDAAIQHLNDERKEVYLRAEAELSRARSQFVKHITDRQEALKQQLCS
mmetsp:Transcript_70344/g.153261  ORF Transcript_70344/g.153261 Transcript_70344/m.153261 type:complete len:494 (-) Transcript_70344:179-1660(-)